MNLSSYPSNRNARTGAQQAAFALTMLGIIIGVGAVIAMVSVGQGAQQQAQATDRGHGFQHSVRRFRIGYPRRNAHGLGCDQNTRL